MINSSFLSIDLINNNWYSDRYDIFDNTDEIRYNTFTSEKCNNL